MVGKTKVTESEPKFVIDKVGNKKRKKNTESNDVEPAIEEEQPVQKSKKASKKSKEVVEEAEEIATENREDDETEDQASQSKKKKKSKDGSSEEAPAKNTGTKRGSEAGRLDESTLPYVREVYAIAKADEFETDEDRTIFVDNVWRELKMGNTEQLVRLITHKEGSMAVQSLQLLSNSGQLYRICKSLKGVMPRVIFNPYGSHVLEGLFEHIPRLVNASMEEFKQATEDGEENGGEAGQDLETLEQLFQDT